MFRQSTRVMPGVGGGEGWDCLGRTETMSS